MSLSAPVDPMPPRAPLFAGLDARRPFTVGDLLSRSFSIWWQNLGKFSLLALAVYLPLIAVGVALGMGGLVLPAAGTQVDPSAVAAVGAGFGVVWLLTMALALVQMAALTYGALQSLAGRPVRFGELLRVGLRRAPVVLGVGLVAYLSILGGFLLLVIPGFIVLTAVSVSIPVAVVERNGVFGAVRRSFALTKGHRLALFAAFAVFFGVTMGLSTIVNLLLPLLAGLLGQAAAAVGVVLSLAVNLVMGSLPTVAPAVAYHDLRAEKEGVDTEALVQVFG